LQNLGFRQVEDSIFAKPVGLDTVVGWKFWSEAIWIILNSAIDISYGQ